MYHKQTVKLNLVKKHLNFAKYNVKRNVNKKSESEWNLWKNHPKDSAPTNGSNLLIHQRLRLVTSEPFVPDDSVKQSDVEKSQNGTEMKQLHFTSGSQPDGTQFLSRWFAKIKALLVLMLYYGVFTG